MHPELISGLSEGFFAQTDFGDVGSQPTRYCGPFFSAADDRSRPHDQLQGAFAPSGHPNPFFSAGSAGRRRGDAVAFAAIDLVRPGAAGLAHRVDKARKLLPTSFTPTEARTASLASAPPRRSGPAAAATRRPSMGDLVSLDNTCASSFRISKHKSVRRQNVSHPAMLAPVQPTH